MNSNSMIIPALLFMAAFGTYDVMAADQNRGREHSPQVQLNREISPTGLELETIIGNGERVQQLLCDTARMHSMLDGPGLRRKMLQHPRFMQEIIQTKEIHRKLLSIENRDGIQEITRNQEVLQEIEDAGAYPHSCRDPEDEILKELLSAASGSETAADHCGPCP